MTSLPMIWLNPSGLWSLAGLAAVIVLYLFYRRYKPLMVTGLFLWGVPRRDDAGGRKRQEPLRSRSFLLDLLAALFLALAISGPAFMTGAARPVIVILDDSFAMRSRNCRQEATARAAAALGGANRAAVILAGERPRVLSGTDAPASEALKRLETYMPSAFSGDLAAAIALAAQLYGDGLDMHVITNREPASLSPGNAGILTVHILHGAGDNLALGKIWRMGDADGGEKLVVAVRNYSAARRRAALTVESSSRSGAPFSLALDLPPREEVFAEIRLAVRKDAILNVRLDAAAGGDAVFDDSRALVPPTPDATLSFGFDGIKPAARRYFRLALEAAGCVQAAAETTPELLITGGSDARGSALTLELAPEGMPGVFFPPVVVDSANGLCRDVDLSATPWTVANLDVRQDAREIYIMAGDTPLYWRSSLRRLHLNLVPERSQVVRQPAWPALLANLADEGRRLKPGLRKTAYLPGEAVEYRPASADAAEAVLVGDGQAVVSRFAGGVMHSPVQAGLYVLQKEGMNAGSISVLPAYGEASDTTSLADREATRRFEDTGDGTHAGLVDLTFSMLALALLCLGMNWRHGGGQN